MVWIKICGFCETESAVVAADLGADAIGLNFVPRSKRCISLEAARRIAESLRGRTELVGVVEGMSIESADHLRCELRLDRVQIHCPLDHANAPIPGWAYCAVGVSTSDDAEKLMVCSGDRLLVDTLVNGATGGTGQTFDWSLVLSTAQRRRVIVAGGLNPSNVARAILCARPFGVDVASGVEFADRPGHKDPRLIEAFIEGARAADVANSPQTNASELLVAR